MRHSAMESDGGMQKIIGVVVQPVKLVYRKKMRALPFLTKAFKNNCYTTGKCTWKVTV